MGEEKTQTMRLSEFLETAIAETVDVTIAPFDDQAISVRPLMLRRALGNLINNALKYGTKCKLAIEVQAGFISFHVDDDGPGIPETQRPDVFKAFQRLDDARNQNVEGVGLGLSIAQDIAQLHGGRVDLSDSEMGGLRATISLPL